MALSDQLTMLAARAKDRAQHRAERAEDDTALAIDFALAAIDEAGYAVLDATLARQKVDALSEQHSRYRLRLPGDTAVPTLGGRALATHTGPARAAGSPAG